MAVFDFLLDIFTKPHEHSHLVAATTHFGEMDPGRSTPDFFTLPMHQ